MKQTDDASVSVVGQPDSDMRGDDPNRTVRISARLTERTAAAKPPGLSWGDYIERLQEKRGNRDLLWIERTRYAAWTAVCLDQLAREIPRRLPDDPAKPMELRIDRLVALASVTQQIAGLRAIMEEVCRAP
jgi:hypothetical protein